MQLMLQLQLQSSIISIPIDFHTYHTHRIPIVWIIIINTAYFIVYHETSFYGLGWNKFLHRLGIYPVLSPTNRILTGLPPKPIALTTCGSPGTRSIAWSLNLRYSPSTSSSIPLIGFFVDNVMVSPSGPMSTFSPKSATGGKLINLKGSGLIPKF